MDHRQLLIEDEGRGRQLRQRQTADLVTDREFTNFEISLEWKATTGGNSGIIYGVVKDPKLRRTVEDRT